MIFITFLKISIFEIIFYNHSIFVLAIVVLNIINNGFQKFTSLCLLKSSRPRQSKNQKYLFIIDRNIRMIVASSCQ